MADFLLGESISEQIRICPYENNHRIKLKSMEAHLEKCRGRNLPKKYMKCPYNPNHVKFVEEMELHLEICPDMLIFGTRTGIDEEIGQNVKYKIEHRDVQGEEDWEDADENPETYNPLLKLEVTRFQPKNIKKRYEKIYHPDAQLVLTSASNLNKAKIEQAESLSHFDQEYWKERGGDQGLPHVHQWLQHVSAPTIQSEPFINDELHSSEKDDNGTSKRPRLYPSTAAPRSIDNMANSHPRSADHTDLSAAKDDHFARSSQIKPYNRGSNDYEDDFAALNGVRSFSPQNQYPKDKEATFHSGTGQHGNSNRANQPGAGYVDTVDEEFAALNQVPKFFASAGRR